MMTLARLRDRGVTMVETLVALAILSMMIVAVYASFNGTVKGMERTEQMQERYMMIRNSLNTMSTDLSMAYLSFNRPQDEARHFTLFEGRDNFDADSLTFSSFSHLRVRKDANESDQTIIQYLVEDDPEEADRQHLYRRESRRLTGDLPENLGDYFPAYVLCEDVASLELEYWDIQKEDWVEEWQTMVNDAQPDRLPQRVKIKLGVKDHTGEVAYYSTQVVLPMQEKIDLSK
jgi:general secretion pathway protein J